jgi:peptide/nickel transport system substrate-binding protein
MSIKATPSLLIAIVLLALIALPACNGGTDPPPNGGPPTNGDAPEIKNPDSFIIATTLDVVSLDPAYAYDVPSAGQIQSIYDTLIMFDGASTSDFLPSLATEWNISSDGKTYRFKIREGVTFHNGNPMTPEDVEYSFERGMIQDYGLGPQWMFFEPLFGPGVLTSRSENGLIPMEQIESKVEVDGDWVQFNLAAPYEPFLQILASSWGSIVDMDWSIDNGDWNGTTDSYEELNNPLTGDSPLHQITNGTGPFMLEYWEPGIEISLIRNPDYWGGVANFERIITKVVIEWSTRKLMLELGDIDAAFVPPEGVEEIRGVEGITAYEDLPLLLNQAFFFQFIIDPTTAFIGSGKLDGNGIPLDFFSDSDVRKGFAYAFDWETYIADGLFGNGQQVASPIVEGLPYYNPDWQTYSFDLTKAEEYLRTAWDGLVWEKGFEFTLAYASGDTAGKIASEIIQNNLLLINPEFKINIQLMSWPTMLAEMVVGRLPMFVNGWTADYPDPHNFVFPYMHSTGTFSGWQKYNNPDVDLLIEQAISSEDPAKRQSIYTQLAEIYFDEVPSIMIAQFLGPIFLRDWIQGFVYNPIRPDYVMYAYFLSKEYP